MKTGHYADSDSIQAGSMLLCNIDGDYAARYLVILHLVPLRGWEVIRAFWTGQNLGSSPTVVDATGTRGAVGTMSHSVSAPCVKTNRR